MYAPITSGCGALEWRLGDAPSIIWTHFVLRFFIQCLIPLCGFLYIHSISIFPLQNCVVYKVDRIKIQRIAFSFEMTLLQLPLCKCEYMKGAFVYWCMCMCVRASLNDCEILIQCWYRGMYCSIYSFIVVKLLLWWFFSPLLVSLWDSCIDVISINQSSIIHSHPLCLQDRIRWSLQPHSITIAHNAFGKGHILALHANKFHIKWRLKYWKKL